MRSKKFVAVGLGCLALAGLVALLPFPGHGPATTAPQDMPRGSDVAFAGVLAPVPNLAGARVAGWSELAAQLDNATYLLTGGEAGVTVLVTLPEEAAGHVVVRGTVVARLADDGTGHSLVLVRGRA